MNNNGFRTRFSLYVAAVFFLGAGALYAYLTIQRFETPATLLVFLGAALAMLRSFVSGEQTKARAEESLQLSRDTQAIMGEITGAVRHFNNRLDALEGAESQILEALGQLGEGTEEGRVVIEQLGRVEEKLDLLLKRPGES